MRILTHYDRRDLRTHLDIDVEDDLLLVRPDEKFDGWRVEIGSKVVVGSFGGARLDIDLAEDGLGVLPHMGELTIDGTLRDDGELVEHTDRGLGNTFSRQPIVSVFINGIGHSGYACIKYAGKLDRVCR